ncbi:acyl-CoA dehydrogenase family protein [Streptomyces sp. SKN60]|uniref:acyl-CoA dehydrogenase family protein n=1 Tax=Streptomyces TaxID=1883 RepID=UPI002246EA29|nr:acyl-CoA dehydrogenase family protein [Streptomyces sp. SKN60]MCX2182056.1 acyl-CoA dehydrogenase [Streptomyces sp. SKN60]
MTTVVDPVDSSEVAVQERIARLEHEFGDLDDPGNPLGAQQFLAADEERRLLPAAERLLDAFGLNAEFVPVALGGRLDRLDVLARVLRVVFRRDAALGLGYGLTSYLAAVGVWTAGTPGQRQETAALLLAHGRMACAYPEPPQGNDFLRNRLTAVPDGAGYRVGGRKEALNNGARAGALVLFADTPDGLSALLTPGPAHPDGAGIRLLPRRPTTGVRGCAVQGLAFDGPRPPTGRLLGPAGGGTRLAEHVFPLTRSAGLSMTLGCADTALRTTTAFARSRRRRSPASLHSSRTRTALVNAFADLLVCDCLSLVATRATHVLPRESRTLGAVAKYLLPMVLTETMDDLSIVLGSEAYATSGGYAIFQKTARDLPILGLGSAGASASRAVLVAQLRRLPAFGTPQAQGDAELGALFRPFDAALPPCEVWENGRPADRDSLLGSLEESARHADGPLAEAAGVLVAQLAVLREGCAELAARPAAEPPGPRALALADRYALLVAGAACLGVWRHRPPGGFLAGPDWAATALTRVAGRLDRTAVRMPEAAADQLLGELLHRFDDARSYDLYATALGRS